MSNLCKVAVVDTPYGEDGVGVTPGAPATVTLPAARSTRVPVFVVSPFQLAGLVLGLSALAYLMLVLRSIWNYHEQAPRMRDWRPPVSILKPIYGTEPHLYDCLRSFCEQDWPCYEVIFSAHSPEDPAVAVVHRLLAELPERDIRLVIDTALAGPNRKAANLANGYKHARYDIIILSDSDVVVDRDCIAAMATPFAEESVGAVACVYKALPIDNAASRFLAFYINDWLVPSMLVDNDLRGIDFVFGAMSAVRRSALDAAGGFARLAGYLAEDFYMGQLVTEAGWRVVMSPYACSTVVGVEGFAEMVAQEVRWQRTEKSCRRIDQAMSVVTWPLLPLLVLFALPQPTWVGVGIVALEVMLRVLIHYRLRRSFALATRLQPWLLPLRDCLCFVVWAAGLFGHSVQWRDQRFTVNRDGTVRPSIPAMAEENAIS